MTIRGLAWILSDTCAYKKMSTEAYTLQYVGSNYTSGLWVIFYLHFWTLSSLRIVVLQKGWNEHPYTHILVQTCKNRDS